MPEFYLKIENVVAFTSLGKDIPLIEVANKLHAAEYSPESFPGVVYRINEPRAATLIFSSGKIVCTGAKSIEKAKVAMRRVVDDIRELGIKLPTKFNVKIENIVASTQIKAKFSLEDISFALDNVEYEPEQFPGLVFRVPEPRVAFLLFGSGKIICTGARSIDDIHLALAQFKKKMASIGIPLKAIPPDGKKGKGKEPVDEPKSETPEPVKAAKPAHVAKPAPKPKPKVVKKPVKKPVKKISKKKPKPKKAIKKKKPAKKPVKKKPAKKVVKKKPKPKKPKTFKKLRSLVKKKKR